MLADDDPIHPHFCTLVQPKRDRELGFQGTGRVHGDVAAPDADIGDKDPGPGHGNIRPDFGRQRTLKSRQKPVFALRWADVGIDIVCHIVETFGVPDSLALLNTLQPHVPGIERARAADPDHLETALLVPGPQPDDVTHSYFLRSILEQRAGAADVERSGRLDERLPVSVHSPKTD